PPCLLRSWHRRGSPLDGSCSRRTWLSLLFCQSVRAFVMGRAQPYHVQRARVIWVVPLWLAVAFRHSTNGPGNELAVTDGVTHGYACFAPFWVFRRPALRRGLVAFGIGQCLGIFGSRCNAVSLRTAHPVVTAHALKVGLTMLFHSGLRAFLALGRAALVEALGGLVLGAVLAVHLAT